MSTCPLVVLACESLHVCTVCIWRCEHARFCVEGFYALYINFHSFIHSFMDADNGRDNRVSDFALIRKSSSHVSSLVLTLDGAIPSGHAHRHASVTSLRRISHAQTSVNVNIR